MWRVEGNAETKHRYDGPSPGIVVGVPSPAWMRPGLRERPQRKSELIHWVRHLNLLLSTRESGGGATAAAVMECSYSVPTLRRSSAGSRTIVLGSRGRFNLAGYEPQYGPTVHSTQLELFYIGKS